MTTSQRGIDFIKGYEKLRLKAYRCPAGVWTIAWGHTKGVCEGMTCTSDQGEEWFDEDVANVEREILKVFPGLQCTQGQWDALVSLGFNKRGGPLSFPRDCPKLTAAVRSGNWSAAGAELLGICHAHVNGKAVKLAGLEKRRLGEQEMFQA